MRSQGNQWARSRARTAAGFTLVELMVTLVVAAVLLAIAVPSFRHITASTRLTTTTNNLVDSLNAARMEAIKRNAATQFCGSTAAGDAKLKAACGVNQSGAVYTLVGPASDSSAIQVTAAPVVPPGGLHLKTVHAIAFNGQGLGHLAGQAVPYSGTVALVCSTDVGNNNVRTITMTTGSILATTSSSGVCP